MSFYPIGRRLPAGLQAAKWQLQPLTPGHVAIDYEAVMASREMLNLWSGSSWPTVNFTLDDNLDDLQWHHREHQERIAFTFTLLDPPGRRCLGCLYIRSISELLADNPHPPASVARDAAIARFWVRSSLLAGEFDRQLLEALLPWFAEDWDFAQLYFHTREANEQQVALFESSPMPYQFTWQLPRRGGLHRFWQVTGVSSCT
ncbi:MAG: hypothetical protein R3293_08425 [Candidatus Promineifilaceae bacterium]|nr:hypothetical protein [Candidatus Promineifilaceae bacterium]